MARRHRRQKIRRATVRPVQEPAAAPESAERSFTLSLGLVLGGLIGVFLVVEARSDWVQAQLFAHVAKSLKYTVADGPSPAISFPLSGPLDERRGYVQLPDFLRRLTASGYEIVKQARQSPATLDLASRGISPVYRERSRAGLELLGSDGRSLFEKRQAEENFAVFDDIAPATVRALLFIEDRSLLDETAQLNPAVAWPRLAQALYSLTLDRIFGDRNVPGASTLATQMEKFRHSPDGRTRTAGDKLRQMLMASLRVYQEGETTLAARRQIVVDYLNGLPLGSRIRHGEVLGLGEGLRVWYGQSLREINGLIRGIDQTTAEDKLSQARAAFAFKQVLSLFFAQRRPAYYFEGGLTSLNRLTNAYLNHMADCGVIPRQTAEAAIPQKLALTPVLQPGPVEWHKAAAATRIALNELLGTGGLYNLDRLDLQVATSVHTGVQKSVARLLRSLADPEAVKAYGLTGPHLLGAQSPGGVLYSMTLYEHVGNANVLRVQTDSFDGPFDLNESAKLELGSTAKLRTLVSYLEVVASLWEQYAGLPPETLAGLSPEAGDPLAAWVLKRIRAGDAPTNLESLLEEAMERTYSANPTRRFVTGGGVHRFANFSHADDSRQLTVRDAFRRSVNLVFIRVMQDVVDHLQGAVPGRAEILANAQDPRRLAYLERFVSREGGEFVGRFYDRFGSLAPAERETTLYSTIKPVTARRLAAAFAYLHPQADAAAYARLLKERVPSLHLSPAVTERLWKEAQGRVTSLADSGYAAGMHPLALWLVKYLNSRPGASLSEALAASDSARRDSYDWLFRSKVPSRQNRRIETMMEVDAFDLLAKDWQRVGYPFKRLVPSLATAIGSSGDRPSALAKLVGIVLNDGRLFPDRSFAEIRFAAETPFETVLSPKPEAPRQVIRPDIAHVVRRALLNVVQSGTAHAVDGAFDATSVAGLEIGGKTGTGDNRYATESGEPGDTRPGVMNRTATFVFYIGDRLFGTITAFAPHADNYRFTSALPVKILALMAPKLVPLLEPEAPGRAATAATAAKDTDL